MQFLKVLKLQAIFFFTCLLITVNYEVGILIIVIQYLTVNYVKGPLYRPSLLVKQIKKIDINLVCYSMYILTEIIILLYFNLWQYYKYMDEQRKNYVAFDRFKKKLLRK